MANSAIWAILEATYQAGRRRSTATTNDYEVRPQTRAVIRSHQGIREFVVGTGGAAFTGFKTIAPQQPGAHRQHKRRPEDDAAPLSYDWEFVTAPVGRSPTPAAELRALAAHHPAPTWRLRRTAAPPRPHGRVQAQDEQRPYEDKLVGHGRPERRSRLLAPMEHRRRHLRGRSPALCYLDRQDLPARSRRHQPVPR
jgi:hypothetical protein